MCAIIHLLAIIGGGDILNTLIIYRIENIFMNQPVLWSFEGRASRSKFWLVFLLSIFVSIVVLLFTLLATPALIIMGAFSPVVASVVSILLNVLLIPTWIISIATTVRRFHDRNKSGWWYLIALVPIIGFLWIFIELGFFKGTIGAINFGLG